MSGFSLHYCSSLPLGTPLHHKSDETEREEEESEGTFVEITTVVRDSPMPDPEQMVKLERRLKPGEAVSHGGRE